MGIKESIQKHHRMFLDTREVVLAVIAYKLLVTWIFSLEPYLIQSQ